MLKFKVGDRIRCRSYGRNLNEVNINISTIVALVGPAWGYLVQRDGEDANLLRHVSAENAMKLGKADLEPGQPDYSYLEKGGII